MHFSKVTTTEQMKEVIKLRFDVFVNEQNVPVAEEVDSYDQCSHDDCYHYRIVDDEQTIAVCRIINDGERIKIGRVAVDKEYRGQQIGLELIQQLMQEVERKNIFEYNSKEKYFYLESQVYAIGFYEKLGFEQYGEIFLDAGIDHVKMEKR